MFEEEHKRKDAVEILKLAGVLDDVDADVAELCIEIVPDGKDKLMSLADLMKGVQKIKNELKASVSVPLKAQEPVGCEKEKVVNLEATSVNRCNIKSGFKSQSPSQELKERNGGKNDENL